MDQITTSSNFKLIAKIGYAARGIVYLMIGGLAFLAALGLGGQATDSKGAVINILQLPFGEFMVVMLIVGLIGYVIWRLIQGFKDADSHGTSVKGLTIRTGLISSGVTHLLLAVWATALLVNVGGSDESSSPLEKFLASHIGIWLFGMFGSCFIGVGVAHVFKGVTARFEKYMSIPGKHVIWAKPLCQFGLVARGFVWCVLGWIIIRSAFSLGSSDDKSTTDALKVIADNAYGDWLLGFVAFGLMAFGIYSILESFYRRININPK